MTEFERRLAEVKRMNAEILNQGDEDIWLTWIAIGVPDGADEYDFEYFAEDENEFADLVSLFNRLMR